jgi:YidC/Oxa1 family membrane protein insertase
MWGSVVELFQVAIFGAAHVCGGSLGAGILVISAAIRIALLPLTLRMARQMNAQQTRIAALEPEIKRLQKRFEKNPLKLATATQALYEANGIRPFNPAMIVNLAVQAPIFGAFFAALRKGIGAGVRFLWVGDLARPDVILLGVTCALMAAGISAAPVATTNPAVRILGYGLVFGISLALMWTASSALVLSFGAGSAVSLLQNRILARERRIAQG